MWILVEQVHLADGEEGSFVCLGESLIYCKVVVSHKISIGYEYSECLARSIEGVDQPSAQVIERLL